MDDKEPRVLRPQPITLPERLTDDEWARVKPLISPAKRGGNRRHVDVREVMNGVMYVLRTGVSGERSRRTCQRAARRCIISTCGAGTARSIASITISMWILRVTCVLGQRLVCPF